MYRKSVGRLNWMDNQGRPIAYFDVGTLTCNNKSREVEDMLKANKVLHHLRETTTQIPLMESENEGSDAQYDNREQEQNTSELVKSQTVWCNPPPPQKKKSNQKDTSRKKSN